MRSADFKRRLVGSAADRYRAAGRFAFYFARSKLAADPVYTAILAQGLIPDRARVLDLGCGQGLLAAWLLAAEECRRAGRWYGGWPEPAQAWSFEGIESWPLEVERARRALGARASVALGDIRSAPFNAADVVVLLDVLHYLDPPSQEAVLSRVRAVLSRGGVLLLRIGDADARLAFKFSNWVDRAALLLRGRGSVRLHCRSARHWIELLEQLGFQTDAIPMSVHTPFANVLLVAQPR